jgi:hypothetical protein
VYPRGLQSELPAEVLGAVLGAAAGAAVGGGCPAPKQVGTSGVGLATQPTIVFQPGTTWTIKFESDQPIAAEDFFVLADAIQRVFPDQVIEIRPIDQTHFTATIQPTEPIEPGDIIGKTAEIGGVKYTATGAYAGSYRTEAVEEVTVPKRKLSTGAVVGLSLAGVAAAGGIVYATTRKKSRRSRRS